MSETCEPGQVWLWREYDALVISNLNPHGDGSTTSACRVYPELGEHIFRDIPPVGEAWLVGVTAVELRQIARCRVLDTIKLEADDE